MISQQISIAGSALGAVALLILIFGFWTNRDVFSPGKFLTLVITLAFADIAVSQYNLEVYGLASCLLIVAAILVFLESGSIAATPLSSSIPGTTAAWAVVLLWVISLAPLGAQLYAFHHFGGWQSYIGMIGLRVVGWRGMGHVRLLINSMALINLVYFAILLLAYPRLRVAQLVPYTLHLLLVIAIGLLSGSRGTTILPLVAVAVLYNFLRRPIRLGMAGALISSILVVVMMLGVARTGYRWTHKGLETGFSRQNVSLSEGSAIFSYGAGPAQLVVSQQPRNLEYGRTYFVALTNFVPRRFWPAKPASGGVVMTTEYYGNRWRGLSNIAPGIFGEGILNFGAFGILSGSLLLFTVQIGMLLLYRRLRSADSPLRPQNALWLAGCYALLLPVASGLVYMEFANAFVTSCTRVVLFIMIGYVVMSFATTLTKFARSGSLNSDHDANN